MNNNGYELDPKKRKKIKSICIDDIYCKCQDCKLHLETKKPRIKNESSKTSLYNFRNNSNNPNNNCFNVHSYTHSNDTGRLCY